MANAIEDFYSILAGAISKLPEADRKTVGATAARLQQNPGLHADVVGLLMTIEHSRPPYLHEKDIKPKKPKP
jgi:hypothetical protein